jgi:hypothetical protein
MLSNLLRLSSAFTGQFYVIGSPQEVFGTQNPRSLAPRAGIQIESTRGGVSVSGVNSNYAFYLLCIQNSTLLVSSISYV